MTMRRPHIAEQHARGADMPICPDFSHRQRTGRRLHKVRSAPRAVGIPAQAATSLCYVRLVYTKSADNHAPTRNE